MTLVCYWVFPKPISTHLILIKTSSTAVTTHSPVPRLHVPGNNWIKVLHQHESPAQLNVLKCGTQHFFELSDQHGQDNKT